jgi:hypothetical protein
MHYASKQDLQAYALSSEKILQHSHFMEVHDLSMQYLRD